MSGTTSLDKFPDHSMVEGGFMPETQPTPTGKTTAEKPIITIERNGRIFQFIDHYTPGQTFTDIVENALRRESDSD